RKQREKASVLCGPLPGAGASRLYLQPSRGVSIQGRQFLHARRQFLAWNVFREKLSQLLQTRRFRARPQQEMQKVQVLNALRPSGCDFNTLSTTTVQPALRIPSSLASTMPNSELSRIASPIISL